MSMVTAQLPRVFLAREAVQAGVLTRGALRSARFTPLVRGAYTLASQPVTHELMCEAALLIAPTAAGLTGRSAATVLGLPLAGVRDPVELAVPEGARFGPVRGLQIRRVVAGGGCVGKTSSRRASANFRLATPQRIGFDLAVSEDLATAVARLDAAVRHGIVDLDGLKAYVARSHERGVVGVRRALLLVDPRAESVPESKVRVVLAQAGLPVVPQYRVTVCGAVVARVDLALPELRIAIEYDGRWHREREQFEADRRRLNDLRAAGWSVVFVTAELLSRPEELVRAVRTEVARRSR